MRRWAEARPATRIQTGFTLLELVIVIILVILLFLAAWWRLLPLRGDAEAAHVATTIGTLRSSLGLHVAERIVNDSLEAVAELDGGNPMRLLQQTPGNYVGVVAASGTDMAPGTWYFEEEFGRLGYRLRYPQYLIGSPEGPVDLHWRIRVQLGASGSDTSPGSEQPKVRAVTLETLHERRWRAFDAAAKLTEPQQ